MRKSDATPEEWAEYLTRSAARIRAWREANREEFNARRREHRKRNAEARRRIEKRYRDAHKEYLLAASRLRRTGMSDILFQRLVELQGNKCAVCLLPFEGNRRFADHDHDTKKPRGVLCIHCNAVEGHARKVGLAPEELGQRLGKYLAYSPARSIDASE